MQRFNDPISGLFAAYVSLAAGTRVLLLHSDDPALARWALDSAGSEGSVTALPNSHRALTLLARVPGLTVSDAVYPDSPADVVLLSVPKSREQARAYLVTGLRALAPGRQMFLAGPNAGGVKTALKDAAALVGSAPILGYKSSHRIGICTRPAELIVPPDWIDDQPQTRTIPRPDGDLRIVTMPGVFSWDHLDDGTALLLDHLGVEPGSHVLDIGCGTGIIGMVAARAGASVTLIDDDLLAVRCAQASVEANGLADRCTVLPGDLTGPVHDQRFDLVLSNPPFHKGIDVTTSITGRLVHEAHAVLRPGGRLRLVANRFLPYPATLQDVFGNITTLIDTGRYHVLEAVR